MNLPFLSVVIANYNYGRFLEEAILSVVDQGMIDEVELIVCDAKSTDNSVEIIKKYDKYISWWCSEQDGGQSAAFNKGFLHANGRFLTWLNADDVMLPGTIATLKAAAENCPEQEWWVGGCLWLDPGMRVVNCGRGRPFSEIRYREGNVNVWGPSSFFTKRLLDSVGGLDERFHYMMDTDMWLRFAMTGARYRPFCNYAWGLRLHPAAKMSGHNFAADGSLKIGETNFLDEKRQKAEVQKRQEQLWRSEYFKVKKATLFSRIISMNLFAVFAAKMDLRKFRGRHYLECFR